MGKTYKNSKGGKFIRRPRNKGERKANADAKDQGVKVRGKRSNSNLPSDWDDKPVESKSKPKSYKKKPTNRKGSKSFMESKSDYNKFLLSLMEKNYADADKYLHKILSKKMQDRILDEYDKPLF